MFSHLDQAQADAGEILARQPVQQLKQLQLIVEIVLEPQDGLVVIAEARERAIPLGESRADVAVAAPAEIRQRTRADVGERLERCGLGNGAVVERVVPGAGSRPGPVPPGTRR